MKVLIISNDVRVASQLHSGLKDTKSLRECDIFPWQTVLDGNIADADKYTMVFAVLEDDAGHSEVPLSQLRAKFDTFLVAVASVEAPEHVINLLHQGVNDVVNSQRDLAAQLTAVIRSAKHHIELESHPANVIAIMGATGGAGATTLAVNVATWISKAKSKCALIDFVQQQGDVGRLLGIKSSHSVQELCSNTTAVDTNILERSMERHSSGLEVLASRDSIVDELVLEESFLNHIVELAHQVYDHLILDLGSCREISSRIELLRKSTTVVLPLRLDFSSVCRARAALDYLASHRIDESKIRLIGNRFGMSGEISQKQTEKILGRAISFTVPDATALVNLAVNCGVPTTLDSPKSRFARSVSAIAEDLLSAIPDATQNRQTPTQDQKTSFATKGIDMLKQTLSCF